MYIQITTACNMSCSHCVFGCKKEIKGTHMSRAIYDKALSIAEDYESYIVIGGGEPTVHPRFWEFLGLALGSQISGIWMATNGKRTRDALRLSQFSKNQEFFTCALSMDEYHEPIDYRVLDKFKNDKNEIRSVTRIINQGTAKESGFADSEDCACPDTFINPYGDVHGCGCDDALLIGHVSDPDISDKIGDFKEYACEHDFDCASKSRNDEIDGFIQSTMRKVA